MSEAGTIVAAAQEPRPHWSYSRLACAQRCPLQYRFRYLDKIPLGSPVPAIRGLSVHAGAAHNLRQKIQTRRDLPLDEVTDRTAQDVEERFAGPVHLTREEMTVGLTALRARTTDHAVAMARAFHLRGAPGIRPVMVEELIRVRPDPSVLPFDLVVRPDVVDDHHWVRDIKTKEKEPRPGDEHTDQQLTIGAMVVHSATGRFPEGVCFDVLVQDRRQAVPPRYVCRRSTRTPEDVAVVIRQLAEVEKGIRAGSFPGAAPGSWNCSPLWCGYWSICPHVAGRRARGEG